MVVNQDVCFEAAFGDRQFPDDWDNKKRKSICVRGTSNKQVSR